MYHCGRFHHLLYPHKFVKATPEHLGSDRSRASQVLLMDIINYVPSEEYSMGEQEPEGGLMR